jgi:hypothetical protein
MKPRYIVAFVSGGTDTVEVTEQPLPEHFSGIWKVMRLDYKTVDGKMALVPRFKCTINMQAVEEVTEWHDD